jgi:Holliday junction DNA helicase RuvB
MNVSERLRVYTLLRKNENWVPILREALEVQKRKEEEYREMGYGESLGFEWWECHAPASLLNHMVAERLLDITLKTRSSTHYRIRDPELLAEALEALEEPAEVLAEEERVPEDLFDIIVGHEKIKWAFKMALASEEPVHILLVGPVATAKSQFLSELARLSGSRYVLGSAFSKAGLVDYLLEYRPKYLLLDEIEKSDGRDLAALLSLMQTGIVTRLKKGMREQIVLKTWVFAAANRVDRLPQEIKSRFLIFHLREYTEEEFRKVALAILRREGIDDSFARKVVESIIPYSRDVRDAVKVARLCKSEKDIQSLVQLMWPRGGVR